MVSRDMGRSGDVKGWLRSYLTPAGKTAAWNLSGLIVFQVLGQLCAFAIVLLVTNRLGCEQYGQLAFALSLQFYFSILGTFAVKSVVVREGTHHPDDVDECMARLVSTDAPKPSDREARLDQRESEAPENLGLSRAGGTALVPVSLCTPHA